VGDAIANVPDWLFQGLQFVLGLINPYVKALLAVLTPTVEKIVGGTMNVVGDELDVITPTVVGVRWVELSRDCP